MVNSFIKDEETIRIRERVINVIIMGFAFLIAMSWKEVFVRFITYYEDKYGMRKTPLLHLLSAIIIATISILIIRELTKYEIRKEHEKK